MRGRPNEYLGPPVRRLDPVYVALRRMNFCAVALGHDQNGEVTDRCTLGFTHESECGHATDFLATLGLS